MAAMTRKQQIEAMLAEEPNDPELRYALAMEFVSNGDDHNASLCLGELSTLQPDYVPAYFQRAQALIRLNRPEEARPVVEKGIATARKQGDLHAADELQALLYALE
jgi:thioredoxin-like negative regulator of GroEL